ncbi:radical SAM protein, partial [Candidatus Woesearchaeota archaeon]|nr:radical SAM protein [Candidatus Woesearchaeota archaeon]
VDYSLDYNIFDINRYFNKEAVLPLKTSHGCYYARCAFCTHHKGERYFEYELNNIEKTIMDTKHKYFFIIDDMVSKGRIIEISKIMKKYNKDWVCQLRPTKDYDCDTLKKLKEAGCNMIIWGVESGCQRVLDIMGKGTNVDDVSKVLQDSHEAGIRNVVYIMFGFPGETEEEFIETVKFLEDNNEAIDLVSTSVFGLQRGSLVYDNPEKYGVYEIVEKPRTVLEPKISFKVKEGLSNDDILRLKQKYRKKIEAINKYPKSMNFFREHMLVL